MTTEVQFSTTIQMIIRSHSRIALLAACLVALVLPASASIVVVAPTSSSTGSLTITQDITFTITTAISSGNTFSFALDKWVTYDNSGQTQSAYSPLLSLSKNGGAPQTYGIGVMIDNYGSTFGALTPGDGFFNVANGPALSINDTLTLKAATYTLGTTATDSFNPQATQTFTGNMFVVNSGATQISNTVSAVPEPGSAALLGLGLSAVLGMRRRR